MRFSRKGSKVVLLSALSYLFMHNTGMVMPGLNTHILKARGSKLQIADLNTHVLKARGSKLQIADLLYFWQLIYLTINKAM